MREHRTGWHIALGDYLFADFQWWREWSGGRWHQQFVTDDAGLATGHDLWLVEKP